MDEQQQNFEALVIDPPSPESVDVIVQLSLLREDLVIGRKVMVPVERRVPCDVCEGKGTAGCECDKGLKKVKAKIEVDVPAGSGAGMQIRVAKGGHMRSAEAESPQGDLVVVLAVMGSGGGSGRGDGSAAGNIAKSPSTYLLYAFVAIVFVILLLALRPR